MFHHARPELQKKTAQPGLLVSNTNRETKMAAAGVLCD